jgi:hypothetical protein
MQASYPGRFPLAGRSSVGKDRSEFKNGSRRREGADFSAKPIPTDCLGRYVLAMILELTRARMNFETGLVKTGACGMGNRVAETGAARLW